MMEMAKNPWIPAPLFGMSEEEEQIEKINDDIPENSMSVSIGALTSTMEDVYLEMVIPYATDKNIHELINKRSGTNDFKYNHVFKFEKNDFKYLHRKTITLVMVIRAG